MEQLLESENIRFVPVTELLVKDYLAMINDIENVGRLIGRRAEPVSEEKEIEWVRQKLREKASVFSMLEKKSGEFIGNIELMDVADSAGAWGYSDRDSIPPRLR